MILQYTISCSESNKFMKLFLVHSFPSSRLQFHIHVCDLFCVYSVWGLLLLFVFPLGLWYWVDSPQSNSVKIKQICKTLLEQNLRYSISVLLKTLLSIMLAYNFSLHSQVHIQEFPGHLPERSIAANRYDTIVFFILISKCFFLLHDR